MIHLSFACNEKSIRILLHFYKLALVVNLCCEVKLFWSYFLDISRIYFQKKITNGKPILNNVFALCFIPVSIKLIYRICVTTRGLYRPMLERKVLERSFDRIRFPDWCALVKINRSRDFIGIRFVANCWR